MYIFFHFKFCHNRRNSFCFCGLEFGPLTTLKNWSGTTALCWPFFIHLFWLLWTMRGQWPPQKSCNLWTTESCDLWTAGGLRPKFWLSSSKFEYPKVGQILTKERNDLWVRVININSFSAAKDEHDKNAFAYEKAHKIVITNRTTFWKNIDGTSASQ